MFTAHGMILETKEDRGQNDVAEQKCLDFINR